MTTDAEHIEATLWQLLDERREGATICPSEIARALGGQEWRTLMEPVRAVAGRLADEGRLEITQRGRAVAMDGARGPLRLGRRERS